MPHYEEAAQAAHETRIDEIGSRPYGFILPEDLKHCEFVYDSTYGKNHGTLLIRPPAGMIIGLNIGRVLEAAPDLLAEAEQSLANLRFLAEQMNSITDNAAHWTVEQMKSHAQGLRLHIEREQARITTAIAKAEGGAA